MAGFPSKVFDMDKKLWEFGKLAIEYALGDVFTENDPKDIQGKLEASRKGKEWLKQFIDYLETDEVGGWRMRRFVDFTESYWLEDLSNPLGIIKGTAQILVDENEKAAVKSEIAGFIIDEVDRLDIKVRDLLNHSRPKPPSLQPLDINQILEERIHFWESQKQVSNPITVKRNYQAGLPPLLLDREQIMQVVLNLLINCCEAMPGGGLITISTALVRRTGSPGKGSHVQVQIEDTGTGIQPSDYHQIFDPFFTTKKEGTGLGLATVNRTIENHKAKISVTSGTDRGTRFTLLFPTT